MIGTPATAAFWTISKLDPARDQQDPVLERQLRGRGPGEPTSLSSALCRPTSSRSATSAPVGVEQARRRAARRCARTRPARRAARPAARAGSRRRDDRGRPGAARSGPRRRRSTPCRRSRTTPWRRSSARRPATRRTAGRGGRGPVVGLGHASPGRRSSIRDDLGVVEQALGRQEPERELLLVARRAHRDRDWTGSWPGPAARISSGSSPDSRSSRTSTRPPRTATTRACGCLPRGRLRTRSACPGQAGHGWTLPAVVVRGHDLRQRSVSWPAGESFSMAWPTPFAYHFSPTIRARAASTRR